MVTTVANSLFDRLIEAFPPNRPYGRKDFRRDPMPGPVRAYLEHALEVKLREALSSDPPEDTWIDTSAPEVREARTRYLDAMGRHQAVPARAWPDALRGACREMVRYLVRPAATLADAVYGTGSGPVEADVVFARVDVYPAYSYFRNVIDAYFKQKGVGRIDRERFEGLLHQIDRQMTSDFDAQQWRRLLDPLVDVLSTAGQNEIPLDILKSFLKEKGAEDAVHRLKHRYGLDGFVPVDELESLFEAHESPEPKPAQQSKARRAPERPAAERREESLPLWKQFEQGFRPAEPEAETRVDESDHPSEPLWKQFRTPSEAAVSNAAPTELSDLERTVLGDRGTRNRDLFVKHLFSGRSEEYEDTLKQLARAASWPQASQIIAQEVFLKHQVNIYSDPAVAFTDAAEAQYRS